MFRDVPECSGMFHVPGFITARLGQATIWTLTTGYHVLHVRGMQIYKTLMMHVQIEQDFPY